MRLGLVQLPSEPCTYVLRRKSTLEQLENTRLVLAVYVDDILLARPDSDVVAKFEIISQTSSRCLKGATSHVPSVFN